MSTQTLQIFDPLYGEICLSGPIAELALTPAVQRLREIRLSNIDSISMPGIANVSRYEHVAGAAYLATKVGFFSRLRPTEALILQAAALLHDAAIAPFGHLVEEALQYASVTFNHEQKFSTLLDARSAKELGGVELQLYAGHESGLRAWADRAFAADADRCLASILASIGGKGLFGGLIAGGLDLDNLDNLTRIAFHMGLDVDRNLPVQIAAGIVKNQDEALPIFSSAAVPAVSEWLELRRRVYTRLMLSREDFVGKAMLVFATVKAFEAGDLSPNAYIWTFTDRDIVHRLLQSRDKAVADTIRSWLLRDLWPLAGLWWMSGRAPDFPCVYRFADVATKTLHRPCFAYRIADKRARRLSLALHVGTTVELGEDPRAWLLGIVSSRKGGFTGAENRLLKSTAPSFFGAECVGQATEQDTEPLPLFERK